MAAGGQCCGERRECVDVYAHCSYSQLQGSATKPPSMERKPLWRRCHCHHGPQHGCHGIPGAPTSHTRLH